MRTRLTTLFAAGAEGHAQADFVFALGDGEGHDAVDADGGEQESEHGKADEEHHGEAVAGEDVVLDLIHGSRLASAICGSTEWTAAAMLFDHGRRIAGGAHADGGAGPGDLPEGDGDLRIVLAQAAARTL